MSPADTADSASPHPGPAAPVRAYQRPLPYVLFLGTLALGLTADLLSKHLVFQSLLSDSAAHQAALTRAALAGVSGRTLETRDVLDCFKSRTVWGVCFKLQTNKGVVFGTELSSSQTVHRLIVGCVSVLLMGMVIVFFITSEATAWAVQLALGSVLAGALGNLYDRLFSCVDVPPLAPARYQVRDFIDCSALGYPWVYNIADALLVIGVVLLALHWFLAGHQRPSDSKSDR